MIRVAYLIVDLEIGGAQRLLQWVVSRLDRTKFQVEVIVLKGRAPLGHPLEAIGIPVRRLHMRGAHDLRAVLRLIEHLVRFRPQILHTHLFHANVLGRICGTLAGVPHIHSTLHTLEGRPWYFPAERLTAPLVDSVEFVSQAVSDHARRRSGLRGAVRRYGVPVPTLTSEPTSTTFVTAARLVPGKGVDDLIRAVEKVPNAKLRVLGDGPEMARLRSIASDRVEFRGWTADVAPALRGCIAAVFPSRLGEGASIAAIEAMLLGIPVIASNVGGMREVVDSEWLIAPGDLGALVSRMKWVVDHPGEARAAGEKARQRALREFSLEETVQGLSQGYLRWTRGRGPI